MKKQKILFITISILFMILTACASSELPYSATDDGASPAVEFSAELPYSETDDGAPPAVEFSSAEEAVKEIKAVKAAGPEKMVHPDDFKIYEKDHIYLLKEPPPLPGYKQTAVLLITQGTEILYHADGYMGKAIFYWFKGYENTENLTKRYCLERYKDTKFFFGKSVSDIYIYWWENNDQFCFMYPADSNVPPEDIIEHLEVEKYDL